MSLHDREDKIMNILHEKQSIKNKKLAELLYVSSATMRRDLDLLEQKGLIVRKYGECSLSKKAKDERNFFLLREQNQSSAKQSMAKRAVKFIKNGDRIMLDGSTSAYNIVHLLEGFEKLLVITNNVKASFALGTMGISNISTGGRMVKKSFTLYGQEAIDTVRNYNVDVMFFSCSGISEDGYLTDENIDINVLRREMMKRSKKTVLLCTKEKFGKEFTHNLCHISEIDEVIFDGKLPDYLLKYIKNG